MRPSTFWRELRRRFRIRREGRGGKPLREFEYVNDFNDRDVKERD